MYLDLDGNGARYQQLARALKRSILEGSLRAGTRLPATRELARELALSRNTVITAYELLCAERLAISREGSGTYAFVIDSGVACSAHACKCDHLEPLLQSATSAAAAASF